MREKDKKEQIARIICEEMRSAGHCWWSDCDADEPCADEYPCPCVQKSLARIHLLMVPGEEEIEEWLKSGWFYGKRPDQGAKDLHNWLANRGVE